MRGFHRQFSSAEILLSNHPLTSAPISPAASTAPHSLPVITLNNHNENRCRQFTIRDGKVHAFYLAFDILLVAVLWIPAKLIPPLKIKLCTPFICNISLEHIGHCQYSNNLSQQSSVDPPIQAQVEFYIEL